MPGDPNLSETLLLTFLVAHRAEERRALLYPGDDESELPEGDYRAVMSRVVQGWEMGKQLVREHFDRQDKGGA